MAALSKASDIVVRAAMPGEGRAIAALWRELWDAHEAWGGYPGSHDDRVYGQLAARLEEDARVRAGQPVLGRHVHLIATWRGQVAGQVEGWFERHGIDGSTPYTCEVRSLIVRSRLRVGGVGRALLDELAVVAKRMGRGASVVLAAEVLEPNPAHGFYAKCGYSPVSWNQRIVTSLGAAAPVGGLGMGARVADARGRARRSRCSSPRWPRGGAKRATCASIARGRSTRRSWAASRRTSARAVVGRAVGARGDRLARRRPRLGDARHGAPRAAVPAGEARDPRPIRGRSGVRTDGLRRVARGAGVADGGVARGADDGADGSDAPRVAAVRGGAGDGGAAVVAGRRAVVD